MKLEDFLEFLKNSKRYTDRDRKKVMRKYLASPELYREIFIPENSPNIVEDLSKMMEKLSKKRALKDIAAIIHDEGYEKFQGGYKSDSEEKFLAFRSFVALVYSATNVAAEAINQDGQTYKEMARDGASRRELMELKRDIESHAAALENCVNALNKMVKREAKHLEKKSGVPRELCRVAICSTPGYMSKAQLSNYLNILLGTIYDTIDENPYQYDRSVIRNIEWGPFFNYLYGKDNTADVAIYITLEGVNRIERYDNPEVKDCWDSLTFYALDALEKTPSALKDTMMGKYMQVIGTMFANGTKDLRVNLLSLDDREYPSLVKIVDKYASAIHELIDQYN